MGDGKTRKLTDDFILSNEYYSWEVTVNDHFSAQFRVVRGQCFWRGRYETHF